MRNLKTTFLGLALVAGIASASATKIAHTPNKLLPTYDWTGNGPNGDGAIFGKTVPEAIDHYGCQFGTEDCATGVPTAGGENEVLRKN